MAANTSPIFPLIPQIEWGTITAANTNMDGTGTVVTIFTADVTNGSHLSFITTKALGTNVATVLRVFINNGSANTVATNNILIHEISLPATTADTDAETTEVKWEADFALPPGYKINVTLGAAVSGGWAVTAVGGKY